MPVRTTGCATDQGRLETLYMKVISNGRCIDGRPVCARPVEKESTSLSTFSFSRRKKLRVISANQSAELRIAEARAQFSIWRVLFYRYDSVEIA